MKKLYLERHIHKRAMKETHTSFMECPLLTRREVCQALCLSSPTIYQSSELSGSNFTGTLFPCQEKHLKKNIILKLSTLTF